MPAPTLKLPNLEDLKNADPKALAIEHGEKVVLLAVVLLLVIGAVSLVGGLLTGGGAGGEVYQRAETLTDLLKAKVKNPPPVVPIGEELKIWSYSLPDSDPWDAQELVEEHIALVSDVPVKDLIIRRTPDVPGTLKLGELYMDHGYGWVLVGAHADKKHLDEWRMGIRELRDIAVKDEKDDRQWAVVYIPLDLRGLVDDMRLLLSMHGAELERAAALAERPDDEFDEGLRQGDERSSTPYWMPHFTGFEVLREDLARPGQWERIKVPPPVGSDVRLRVKPVGPPDWPVDRPWPPPAINPWTGGSMGINTVNRSGPYPAMAGRVTSPAAPAAFLAQMGQLPGGIYFHVEAERLAELAQDVMRAYVDAKGSLEEMNTPGGGAGTPAEQRRRNVLKRVVNRPHGMAVRFIDTTVQPGHRYRYRLRVLIRNPCLFLPEDSTVPAVRQQENLGTDFSRPSPVIDIPPMVGFYLTGPGAPTDGRIDKAFIEIHALFEGVWRVANTQVQVGDPIRFRGPLRLVRFIEFQVVPVGAGAGPPGAAPGVQEQRVVKPVEVELDTGAFLLGMEPTEVLKVGLKRNPLMPPQFLRQETKYRMIFVDGNGKVGIALEGDVPTTAEWRAKQYYIWVKNGQVTPKPLLIRPGGAARPGLVPRPDERYERPEVPGEGYERREVPGERYEGPEVPGRGDAAADDDDDDDD